MGGAWITGITKRGKQNYERLMYILEGTTTIERSHYVEKIYNMLNKEHADMLMI